MFDGVVSELDAAGAVAVAAELRATADVAEARLLQVAAHFADLHPEPFRSAGSTYLPGMERAVVYVGDGCPAVGEFAPVELGAALGITSPAAAYLIGDALALRHRLPRVWARVLAGEVQAWRARRIASACWRLPQTAALVDARIAPIADSVTVHRLDQIVAAAVIDADPDQAAADADRVRGERGVWVGQSDLRGTKTTVVKAATGDVVRLDATIDQVADRLAELGDTDCKDLRRARAIGELADPQATLDLFDSTPAHPGRHTDPANTNTAGAGAGPDARGDGDHSTNADADAGAAAGADAGAGDGASASADADARAWAERHVDFFALADAEARSGGGAGAGGTSRPTGLARHTLYVHLTDHTLATGTGVVRVEDLGPMLVTQLSELLGHGRVVVKPVIDLNDHVSVDAYEIPDRIRERIRLTYPICVFPWCNRRATTSIDIDHVVPYDDTGPPGQTSTRNLVPCCRRHHRVKTHGRWRTTRLPVRVIEWTSSHGARYRVDHTGTHRRSRSLHFTSVLDVTHAGGSRVASEFTDDSDLRFAYSSSAG